MALQPFIAESSDAGSIILWLIKPVTPPSSRLRSRKNGASLSKPLLALKIKWRCPRNITGLPGINLMAVDLSICAISAPKSESVALDTSLCSITLPNLLI
jgi:hypothetical protein